MSDPEVTTGSKERLEVLELDRTPRAEKLARETQLLEGASEVHFSERAFRPRHPATLDEVRAAVDALPTVRPRADLPQPKPLPPAPAPVPAPPRIRDEHRAALAPHLQEGDVLVRVESVYKTDAGEVVDATIEHHGKPHTGTFLIEEGAARKMNDLHHAIDSLPMPKARASPAPAQAQAQAQAPSEKKGRFSMPKLGKKDKAPEPQPSQEASPSDAKPSKFKLPFGKKK